MSNGCSYVCRQQHSVYVQAYLVTESLPYIQRMCLLCAVMLGFVACAGQSGAHGPGAAILQELHSSRFLATVFEMSLFKTSVNFKPGFCWNKKLWLQCISADGVGSSVWIVSCLPCWWNSRVSLSSCYIYPFLKAFRRHRGHQSTCAVPGCSQGTCTLQSTAEMLNRGLNTEFKSCKLPGD